MEKILTKVRPPAFWELTKELALIPEAINALWNYNKKLDVKVRDQFIVIVFPGLSTGDYSTYLLRRFLKSHGYDARGWGLGVNTGYKEGLDAKMCEIVRSAYMEKGKKVFLIGHSLGGVFAREMARLNPKHVRGVITLDAPFNFATLGVNVNVKILYRILSGHWVEEVNPKILKRLHLPLKVPFTAIASNASGVVSAQTSTTNNIGSISENIILDDISHCGMVISNKVFRIIADRLAQPEEARLWQKYQAPKAIEYKPSYAKDPIPA